MSDLRLKLSRRTVERLEPSSRRYVAWDVDLTGFGVRVSPNGSRSYILQYRLPGLGRAATSRKLTLGRHGQITADQARELATDALGRIRAGGDPARERQALRSRPTVAELCRMYLAWLTRHRKPRSVENAKGVIERYIKPAVGHMAVADVRRRDVVAIVQKLEDAGHPRTGGKVIQVCRAMFNRAELDEAPWYEMRAAGTNPCRKLPVHLGKRRERKLELAELGRLGQALRSARDRGENPWLIALILLWLLTGARMREIMHARWDWIDWQNSLLRLPTSKTGEKAIYLSPAARAVLERVPHLDANPYIIVGTRPGRPMANPYKGWRRILAQAGIEGVTPHDTRRTFASMGLGRGLTLEQIGALLGHARVETTKGYSFLHDQPARDSARLIGEAVQGLLEGET